MAAEAEAPRRAPRGGADVLRVLVVAAVATGMAISVVLLRDVRPAAPAPAMAAASGVVTGAWFCPHGGMAGGRAWLALMNPGAEPVAVRVTSLSDDREPTERSASVPAGSQLRLAVSASQPGSATEVEYFGGWIAAAAVVSGSQDAPGIAAERCAASGHPRWYVPDGTTELGQSSDVVLMNPFDSDAAVDVTIRTEERVVRPGSLTPYVVPGRRSVALSLNALALLGPRERTLAVDIDTKIGRVVVGSTGRSEGDLRAEVAIPDLQRRWTIGVPEAVSWWIPTYNPGRYPATVSVLAMDGTSQRMVPGLTELGLGAVSVRTFELVGSSHTATLVQVTNDVPVASVARVQHASGTASVSGSARAHGRWVVLPGLPDGGGEGWLVLSNPTLRRAWVELTLVGEAGTVVGTELDPVLVPPGRAITVPLPEGAGGAAVMVEAVEGAVVASGAWSAGDTTGFSAMPGIPLVRATLSG